MIILTEILYAIIVFILTILTINAGCYIEKYNENLNRFSFKFIFIIIANLILIVYTLMNSNCLVFQYKIYDKILYYTFYIIFSEIFIFINRITLEEMILEDTILKGDDC